MARSAAFWSELEKLWVEGVEQNGKYHLPTHRELSKQFGVSARAIGTHAKKGEWAEKRFVFAKSAGTVRSREGVLAWLRVRQASNSTYVLLAQQLRNAYATAVNRVHQGSEMSVAEWQAWARVLETGQKIERTAAGEGGALIERGQQTQAELDEVQARVAKIGGPATEDELVEQLKGIPGLSRANVIRLFGMEPVLLPKPKKG